MTPALVFAFSFVCLGSALVGSYLLVRLIARRRLARARRRLLELQAQCFGLAALPSETDAELRARIVQSLWGTP